MRGVVLGLVVFVGIGGCSSNSERPDASPPIDARIAPELDAEIAAPAIDAMVDAPPACPKVLLTGGADVGPQGWLVATEGPAMLTYAPGDTQLQTSTLTGARTSGQLMIYLPRAVEPDQPFKLQVVMLVDQVNTHNALDSAAAILASFTPPVGNGAEREQMIYLDATRLGWADDTQSFAAPVVNGAYHTYELSVDAARVARVTIDGAPALMRSNFTTNGNVAIGDQTNDARFDATMHLRSVTLLCP